MENNLAKWIKFISSQSLPVFNSTVQSVIRITADEKASCKQLADMIMRDASLTSRVIQIANTPIYNRGNTQSNSIRRMVLLIGFKKIAEICLTLSILDSVTDKHTQKLIYKIISKSFQAATQAYSIAELCRLKNSDKIYIAALLKHIGEIAFWSLTGKESVILADLLSWEDKNNEQLQQRILGTTFKSISLGLVNEWNLSDLLRKSLSVEVENTLELKCIKFGYEIAEINSHEYSDLEPIATYIARETNLPVNEVIKTIKSNMTAHDDIYNQFIQ